MKIDLNDPRITAFALGDLTGDDAIELARAVRSDTRVRKAVDEVRETAHMLGSALSPTGAEMLTPGQRAAVRSAGAGPVITDIASARIPFWKKPAVVAAGVAATVAAMLYIVGGRQSGDGNTVADQSPSWNWSHVDSRDLTAPVIIDSGNADPATGAARAVSAAASNDTDGFRDAVRQRIKSSEMKAVLDLPALDAVDWQEVSPTEKIAVPMASGATSWPWVRRHLMDAGKLPPRRAVRIEEMINHFSYSKPTMAKHGGLTADMELCSNPWNPQTHLLAVHVRAQPGADIENLYSSLVISSDRVKKLRLLGYASAAVDPETEQAGVGTPAVASRTRGNYVLYELLLGEEKADSLDAPLVYLSLEGMTMLTIKEPKTWSRASADMRFATLIAATGMVLSDYPAKGELDAARLATLADLIEKTDNQSLSAERREGLKLVRKAAAMLGHAAKDG